VPAVSADDLTVLPRVPVPDGAMARQRAVASITTAPRGFEGEGFPVHRAFAGVELRDLDPFIPGSDGGDRLRAGRVQGDAVASAPWLRDGRGRDRLPARLTVSAR
jgi:hypothetical protein